ncbi:MAG: undecaprenyl-diphosphate phosphatase [Candidatus Thorarchaeota archaeon]|jgi:undecaprenyl-diphosphatase
MEPWQVVVAVLQGLVEWLPISSEGQVVLFLYNFTTVPAGELLTLVAWLHLGTALAVIVRYPRLILDVLTLKDRALFRLLVVATACTAVTAIPLYIFLKGSLTVFQGELVNILVGILLLVTAVMLYLPTRSSGTDSEDQDQEVTDTNASIVGLVQGFAVLPGLSRSGITISSLLMLKVKKEDALRFSFLISVPAVFGILAVELITGSAALPSTAPLDLLIMVIIVFLTGLGSMELLLRIARRVSFWKLCLLLAVIAIAFGFPSLF